jgi:hypothetical protein
MKCPICELENKESTVRLGTLFTTLMGNFQFYDKDGVYHMHDPNTKGQNASCSNNHKFCIEADIACPAEGCSRNDQNNRCVVKAEFRIVDGKWEFVRNL